MALKLSNNADGILALAISDSDTSLTLRAGHGSRFPALAPGDWFPITVVRASDPSQLEIMRCTGRSGDTLTVVRAQEGTSAIAFNAGDVVSLRLTVAALAGAHVDTATKLQTARTLTIGNTGKSFDGSKDVSWSLAEIGATTAAGNYIVRDTRDVNTPTDLREAGVKYEFKNNSTDGLNDGGIYHAVMTFQPWGDSSGGNTHQLGFTNNGNLWLRTAPIGGTWGPWRKIYHSGSEGALSFRNRIINGKMEVSQRGTSWTPAHATVTYTLDRFLVYEDTDGSVSVAQSTDAPTGFQNSLRVTVSTVDVALGATQRCQVEQKIEGYNVRDLVGRTFTLSFWVRSAKTGTHCVSFSNTAIDRSYVAEYTVNAANTWEYKTITVPGGILGAGTWNFQNGTGMMVRWALCSGSRYQTAAGTWATGDFIASPNQVNVMDTAGNIFAITGVQLEPGSYATQFEHRPYGLELALCQRYYEVVSFGKRSNSNPAWGFLTPESIVVAFKQEKRATPTIAEISHGGASHARVYFADTRTVGVAPPQGSSGLWHFYDIVASATAEL